MRYVLTLSLCGLLMTVTAKPVTWTEIFKMKLPRPTPAAPARTFAARDAKRTKIIEAACKKLIGKQFTDKCEVVDKRSATISGAMVHDKVLVGKWVRPPGPTVESAEEVHTRIQSAAARGPDADNVYEDGPGLHRTPGKPVVVVKTKGKPGESMQVDGKITAAREVSSKTEHYLELTVK